MKTHDFASKFLEKMRKALVRQNSPEVARIQALFKAEAKKSRALKASERAGSVSE